MVMERLLELVKQAMRNLRYVLVDFYLIIDNNDFSVAVESASRGFVFLSIDNNDNKKMSCIIVNVNTDILFL